MLIEGYLQPPKGEINKNWKKTKRLIFKSTLFGDDNDRALQKNDGLGLILLMMLPITWIK